MTQTIIVIPAKAGIHPIQDSFPRYLPKSQVLFWYLNFFALSPKLSSMANNLMTSCAAYVYLSSGIDGDSSNGTYFPLPLPLLCSVYS
jgi:hypothetical protein